MFKKIISCIALAFCCLYSFGQNKNIAATRAYCDHNRTIAAQDAVTQLKPVLEDYIVDEVDRVSRSFVTNAYPVPIPITNTIYQITDNVISNRTIYETTNVLVYSQYSITTNIFNYFVETNYVNIITSNGIDVAVTDLDLLALYYPDNNVTNISQFLDASYYDIEILNDSTASINILSSIYDIYIENIVFPFFITKDNKRYLVSQVKFESNNFPNTKSIIVPTTVKTMSGGSAVMPSLYYISFPCVTNMNFEIRYSGLENVYLPSVLRLGNFAFRSNESLKSVLLPNTIEIGNAAFSYCSSLSNINIPNVNKIGNSAFYECNKLSYVSLPSVIEIGNEAFISCDLLNYISFPNLRKLGREAFSLCDYLENITLLQDGVIHIQSNAFSSCTNLKRLKLQSAISIDGFAFYNCSKLEYIYIPNVTNINLHAFYGCSNLKYIDFGPNPLLNVPVLTGELGGSTDAKILVPKSMKASFTAIQAWNDIESRIVEY